MTKGRDLPPLLPLEYCRIDRAARLLECEVEDLIHWGAIQAIILFGAINLMEGKLSIYLEKDKAEELKMDKMSSFALKEFIFSCGNGLSFADVEVGAYLPSFDNISVTLEGAFSGLWPLDYYVLEMENLHGFGMGEIFSCRAGGDFFITFNEPIDTFGELYVDDLVWDDIGINDLFISGEDLKKLHESITTGEPLPSIYNDAELARQAREREAAEQSTREPKVTAKQSDLIRSLIDLHFSKEGRRLDDMGHQAFFNEVLAPALATAGIVCPTTDRSFDDWMKKSRKFSK